MNDAAVRTGLQHLEPRHQAPNKLRDSTQEFLLYSGVNYAYDETLVVPIIENTPEESDLKVSFFSACRGIG